MGKLVDPYTKNLTKNYRSIHEYMIELVKCLMTIHENQLTIDVFHPSYIKNDAGKIRMEKTVLPSEELEPYRAPESFHALKIVRTPVADLYSFGVFMYKMYVGHFPIVCQNTQTWGEAHLTNEIAPFEQTNRQLKRIMEKLLEKNPLHRFQSSKELLIALKKAFKLSSTNLIQPSFIPQKEATLHIDYPISEKLYSTFFQIVDETSPYTHIYLQGQNNVIRKEVVSFLFSKFEFSQKHTFNFEITTSHGNKNALLQMIIIQYLHSIAASHPLHIQQFFIQLNASNRLNVAWLRQVYLELDVLIDQYEKKYGEIAISAEIEGPSSQADALYEQLCFLQLLHRQLQGKKLWIIQSDRNIQMEEKQLIEMIHEHVESDCKLLITCYEEPPFMPKEHVTKTMIHLADIAFKYLFDELSKVFEVNHLGLKLLVQKLLYISNGDLVEIRSYLQRWNEQQFIYFHEQQNKWIWDERLIENQGLYIQMMQIIDEHMEHATKVNQQLLATAAIIGARFTVADLQAISGFSKRSINDMLQQAEKLGIIYRSESSGDGGAAYLFLNNQVRVYLQQFLPHNIDEMHYEIALYYQQKLPNNELERIRSLTHFNQCIGKQTNKQLMYTINENLRIGMHYLDSQNFTESRRYLQIGMQICEHAEHLKYEYYRFVLYLAACEYVCGNVAQSKAYFEQIQMNQSYLLELDVKKYYMWLMEMYVFENPRKAFSYGVKALELYGWKLNLKPKTLPLLKEILKTQNFLNEYTPDETSETDEEYNILCRVAYSISSAFGTFYPKGLIYFYSQFIRHMVPKGMNNELALIVNSYELMIQRGVPELSKRVEPQKLKMYLDERHYSDYYSYILRALFSQLQQPEEVYPNMQMALNKVLQGKEFRNINFALMSILVLFNDDIYKMKAILTTVDLKVNTPIDTSLQLLLDEFRRFYHASSDLQMLESYINEVYTYETPHINYISMNHLEMAYLAGDYQSVFHWFSMAEPSIISVNWIANRKLFIYKHLAMSARYFDVADVELKTYFKKQVSLQLRKMKKWEGYIGYKSSYYYTLLAEYYAILGETQKALTFYQEAISSARKEKDKKAEGIALECLSKLYRRMGYTTGTQIAMMDAINAYLSFGLSSKVKQLKLQSNLLLVEEANEQATKIADSYLPLHLLKDNLSLQSTLNEKGKSHRSNQLLTDRFLTIACQQVTAEFGMFVHFEDSHYKQLAAYGKAPVERIEPYLRAIFNYCLNTGKTFIYPNDRHTIAMHSLLTMKFQSFICVPIKTADSLSTYMLIVGSQYFNDLFREEEQVILESLFKRYLFLIDKRDHLPQQLSAYMDSKHCETIFSTSFDPITEVELAVLNGLIKLHSNEQICQSLSIRFSDLKKLEKQLYHKLNVRKRVELVEKAQSLRLIK